MVIKKQERIRIFLALDIVLSFFLVCVLLIHWLRFFPKQSEMVLIAVAFIATIPVIFSAISSLKNKKISITLLASIALIASLLEREWISVIFINLMIASARIFFYYVGSKSHSAIEGLLKLKPLTAKIEKDGRLIEIPLEEVKKGDRLVVELGEKIPVDGFIEKGEATIDQSSLTGESKPVFKKKGDTVLSSTTVVSGNLIIEAEKIGKETTFEKIIDLVEKSQANKANIYTLVDRFAQWYIIITLLGSIIVYFFSRDLNLVLALLLVSCADDIAVATPLAFTAATVHGVKHGAIIKGSNFLEGLAKVKVLVVDKTGTLTEGKLKIEKIYSFSNLRSNEILKLAAIGSFFSHHPVAKAILNYAKENNILIEEPEKFEEHSGKGTVAIYKNKKIITGKVSFIQDSKIKISEQQLSEINEEKTRGFSVNLICFGDKLAGFISMTDELRLKLKETINKFKELGIEKIIMLTGDNEKIAKKIAGEIGIEEFHANLLPEDKLIYLKKYLNNKYKTAMIGDGVNDAPALALSDIGIAMGAIGSDVAIESADIALMKDEFSQIPELIGIGRSTLKVIRQNLLMWGIINTLGLFLVFLHIINPSEAAAYNFITDFIPILNSLRLFK